MNSHTKNLINSIRQDLSSAADEKLIPSFQRFFKEPVLCYGLKSSTLKQIERKYQTEIKKLTKVDFFELGEELFKSDYSEEAFLISGWTPLFIAQCQPADLNVFARWLKKYINNWAKCDSFCNHTIGDMIAKFPELIPQIKLWTHSDNRWVKRAGAVSFIIPAKHGQYLNHVFDIANTLLLDIDDIVQKGYGWLLKEASRIHQEEVFNYVCQHKAVMPRTALRYAIELMPQNLRQEAMKK